MSRLFDDGNSDYLEVLSVPLAASPLTMAAWYYADDLTADQALISLGCNPGVVQFVFLHLRGSADGDPVAMVAANVGEPSMLAQTEIAYSTGVWQHAAGILNADGSGKVWIDGGNAGIDATGPETIDAIAKTNIGRLRYGDNAVMYMSGRIAEAAIWNAALTDAEVAILAAGFTPDQIRPANLVFYVPLIRDDDQDIVGGLSFTAGGAPTIARHPPIIAAYSPSFCGALSANRTTLQPDGETHDPGDAWGSTVDTRLEAVLDDVDNSMIGENEAETHTITFAFAASPARSTTVGLDVFIRAMKGTVNDTQITAELFIEDDSKGTVVSPLLQLAAWNNYVLNRVEWDGPWTEAQMATAKVKLWYVGDGSTVALITKLNMPIEYTLTRNTRQAMNVAPGVGFMTQRRGGKHRPGGR